MSWITEHKFLCGLGAFTLLASAGLVWYGNQGASRYEAAKADFDQAYGQASGFETFKPYPSQANLEAKQAALKAFRLDTETLQDAFTSYRPEEMVSLSTQAFTDLLKAANDETRQAFSAAGTAVPDDYFCGYAPYKTRVVAGNATPILGYQLRVVKAIMLDLAKAKPSQLINVHRPLLDEENGKTYVPQEHQVTRGLPLEIVFKGNENSLREFLSALANSERHFTVVRSLRVRNEKQGPPSSNDAQFENLPAGTGGQTTPTVDFNTLFSGSEEETEAAEDAAPAAEAASTPAGQRILSQVLGNEELFVFVRLDILLFLPSKTLPPL